MKVGYACTPLGTYYKTTRKFLIKNYSKDLVIETANKNILDLLSILRYSKANDISMFRISSDIIPFASHSSVDFDWQSEFKNLLKEVGDFAKSNNFRLSMHPGQYTVLNSPNDETVQSSILELQYHCEFLNSLGLDKSHKIILHTGGVYNDKPAAIERFLNVYNSLDTSIKDRLVLENDEKSYSIDDLLYINSKCNIPLVFDNLHHFCKTKTCDFKNQILKASKTWSVSDGVQKVHYSEQDLNKKTGSHSKTINTENFLKYYFSLEGINIDIMTEVKDKDFSSFKINNILKTLKKNISRNDLDLEFSRYEFFLKERSFSYLEKAKSLLYESDIISFYKFIDAISKEPIDLSLSKSSLKDTLSYFSFLKNSESNHINNLLNRDEILKTKLYIKKLALKYENEKILSFYFLH